MAKKLLQKFQAMLGLRQESKPMLPRQYVKPAGRCNRWILLAGAAYGDKHYIGAMTVEAKSLVPWATKHAQSVRTVNCDSAQQAREHLPDWLDTADHSDSNVTLIDGDIRGVVMPYLLDFVEAGFVQFYCPSCNAENGTVDRIEHDRTANGNHIAWTSEWLCPAGHRLYFERKQLRLHY